jgi:hypothetical protein
MARIEALGAATSTDNSPSVEENALPPRHWHSEFNASALLCNPGGVPGLTGRPIEDLKNDDEIFHVMCDLDGKSRSTEHDSSGEAGRTRPTWLCQTGEQFATTRAE